MNKINSASKLIKHIAAFRSPSYLIFFVTSRCNARCKMCFNWKAIGGSQSELSIEEIEEMAANMPNMFQIILSGGEPFLREDLVEIVDILVHYTKPAALSIPTNAFSSDRILKTVKTICKKHPNLLVRINVSIDGIGRQHDDIRGVPGLYERVVECVQALKTLKAECPTLAVNVGSVLSKDNAHNITNVFDTVEKTLCPDMHSIGFPRGSLREESSGNFSHDIYKKTMSHIQNNILSKRNRHYPFSHFAPTLLKLISESVITDLEGLKWHNRCVAADKMIVINEKGEVSPCEMLEYLRNQVGTLANRELEYASYGNLRNTNLKALLNSERAIKIKKFIRAGKCQCTFECAIFASLLFRPSTYPLIARKTILNWYNNG